MDLGAVLRKYRLSLLIFVAGGGLSVNLLLNQLETERRSIDVAFSVAAEEHFAAIEQLLEKSLNDARGLASFIDVTYPTRRAQFHKFAGNLLQITPGLQALEWVPRVRAADRSAAEAAARSVFQNFRFTERNATGQLVTSAVREFYFPVYYVEPYRGNEPALGFNLGSNAVRLEALDRATDTGSPAATAGITLVQESASQTGILIFVPVYRAGGALSSAGERRARLLGFALSVLRIGDVVESALNRLPLRNHDIQLRDASGTPAQQLLYTHLSRGRAKSHGADAPEVKLDTRLVRIDSLDFGGRRWSLIATPSPGYFEQERGWRLWGLPLATFLLAMLMIIQVEASRRAVATLHESEARFRGLVEQSIAGTYVIQDGKLIYVNPRLAEIFGYDSAEEIINRDVLSMVVEKDRDNVVERMRERIEGDIATMKYDVTGLRKDGSTIDVGMHGTRATYRGRPAIIGLLQDISERKRAEEEIQRYVKQLETAFMSTVEVTTTLREMRDPYTTGHERRVAAIAVALGAELGFDERRQEGLRVAGLLHDVGKITVPAEILSKPGKLAAVEYLLVQGHVQSGYDVLKGVEFPWPVAEVALQHHERMDGSGYPQGLKGEAILLEARIMAVADVVEAMSSHRPYRPGLGIDKALAEIERGRSTVYDADVADACLRLFRVKHYKLAA